MADDDLIVLRRHSFSHTTPPNPLELPESNKQGTRPRRFSTVAACHRPDRTVDDTSEPNLDNFAAPAPRSAPNNSQLPRAAANNYVYQAAQNPIASPAWAAPPPRRNHCQHEGEQTLAAPLSRALWSRRRHRTVVLSNVPRELVDMRDVLCRVRGGGGPLANSFLTAGPGGASGKPERQVVLTFAQAADAQRYYVHHNQQQQAPAAVIVWPSPPPSTEYDEYGNRTNQQDDSEEKRTAQVHYHTDLAALGLCFDMDPADMPLAPWAGQDENSNIMARIISSGEQAPPGTTTTTPTPTTTTRCLVARACPVRMIERVLQDLGLLPFRLARSPHLRAQVEDIWLDNFGREEEDDGDDDVPVHDGDNVDDAQEKQQQQRLGREKKKSAVCDLHIWFTNTHAATGALMKDLGRYGQAPSTAKLRCEPDPCAGSSQQRVLWHSHGNISLLTLADHGVLDLVLQGWRREQVGALGPAQSLLQLRRCCNGQGVCPTKDDLVAAVYCAGDVARCTHLSLPKETLLTTAVEQGGNKTAYTIADLLRLHCDSSAARAAELGLATMRPAGGISSSSSPAAPAPAPKPRTYLSVLYNAALEAYRFNPGVHDLAVAFQIPLAAIDVLSDTAAEDTADADKQNNKAIANDSRSLLDEAASVVESADTSLGRSSNHGSSEPSSSSSSISPPATEPQKEGHDQQNKYLLPDYHHHYTSHPLSPFVPWSCDIAEFLAMSDQQWMAFGTVFYRPPPGFQTTTTTTSTTTTAKKDSGGGGSVLE